MRGIIRAPHIRRVTESRKQRRTLGIVGRIDRDGGRDAERALLRPTLAQRVHGRDEQLESLGGEFGRARKRERALARFDGELNEGSQIERIRDWLDGGGLLVLTFINKQYIADEMHGPNSISHHLQ